MAIRIVRNEAGNCINFFGSSNPTYWNACLSGEVDSLDATTINVVNDIITAETGVKQYEFFRVPYTDFVDADGNGFASAQETADYISQEANVVGLGGDGIDLIGVSVCFSLDDTSTSIMLDNGYSFGVNTIKAIESGGHIKIVSNTSDTVVTHFYNLEVGNACINDATINGGLNDVINSLNELFTVGAFQSVVIADPFSTMVADVSGVNATMSEIGNGIDPAGDDVYGSTASGALNGYKSAETIDQAGEYFTFDIRNEGQIGFGLVHSQTSYDDGHYLGSATYANPTTFGSSNSSHYGFQFSHWFHPTPNGSWTNYGANTSYSQGPGWYSANTQFEGRDEWLAGNPIKIKVGIDENGFIAISSLKDDGVTWVMHARTAYPVPDGAEFHLGIKTGDTTTRVYTLPKVHLLEPAAPTMYFRYIESPDDTFQYPIFATEEEANYYDLQNGGSGTSHQHVYVDDPTASIWYMPDNGGTHTATAAPTSAILFDSNPINWTEVSSQTNADLAPPTFADSSLTVNELEAVNIAAAPADAGFTTTIVDNDGSGLTLIGFNIEGTAPEVTGDYSSNPSDVYTIDVVRTNSYGSTTATITLTVLNLTAPVTAISGFNHVSGSAAMVDADTMGDGSAVHVNNTVADGERFVIERAYVEANILPSLNAAGDQYIIGLSNQPEAFGTLELADFDAAIVWEYETASSHTFKFYRDDVVQQTIVINSMTQAYYDYAIEIDGTSAWLIACNLNSIMNEPSPANGGNFSNTYEATSIEDTAPVTIVMAALNTTGDISTTDIETITTPTPSPVILTPWSKALDFSGSNEYALKVNTWNGSNPLLMDSISQVLAGPTTTGNTSNASNARPWATAIVFKYDGNSSNQHIWNSGEGAGSVDDNIYLRLDASGYLYFGWGRQGALNECRFLFLGTSTNTNHWHGIYIAHNGTRLSGSDATAANLAAAFDIRWMTTNDNPAFTNDYGNRSTADNWTAGSTGARMDRAFTGSLTIGGRGSNRSFHGKIASMVVTTLRLGVAMPTDAEIELMITDPKKWEDDYRIGQTVRRSSGAGNVNYTPDNVYDGYGNTQIWLMGDGTSDSYSNGIRNEVYPSDQNYSKLQLNSMVSNDIENINITGLS